MSELILNLVPKEKTHNGVRTSAVQEIWLQNYLLLFLRYTRCGGGAVEHLTEMHWTL
jgi:hypothetical protein